MNITLIEKHKIAIIVPAFNVGSFIAECLDSIANQSYRNWECFIVNDGSTDDTLNIANTYAKKDSRFRVISKENGGVSSARNHALELIEKEERFNFISFVDSDDFIDPEMYSLLIQSFEEDSEIRVAICGIYRFGDSITQKALAKRADPLTSEEYVELIFSHGPWADCCLSGGYVPRCLFHREVVTGLRFTSKKDMVEDELYSLKVAHKASKIALINQALYGYRNWKGSLSHSSEFWLMQMKGRKCCIDEASKISERARFTSVVAYLPVAINAFKYFPHPIGLLSDYERELKEAQSKGLIDFKSYVLYKIFTKHPLLSTIYRKMRNC